LVIEWLLLTKPARHDPFDWFIFPKGLTVGGGQDQLRTNDPKGVCRAGGKASMAEHVEADAGDATARKAPLPFD